VRPPLNPNTLANSNGISELRAAGIVHLRVFGSVARGESSFDSDIDLLVDFDKSKRLTLVTVGSLQNRLSKMLGAKVDLSSAEWMREPVRSRSYARPFLPFRDNATHFRDILEAIGHIEDFLQGIDYETYMGDAKTKSAVERQMQIVTEAAYRLDADGERMAPGIDWEGFRGMGNLLRHAYHRIDDLIVWNTIKDELP
jgi:uncharacterized protein